MFNKVKQSFDGLVMKELTRLAGRVAEKARQNASWSDRIPQAISVGNIERTDDGFHISVLLNTSAETGAPHALAFEYGSGEHGEKGQKYPIYPKNASMLAIPESKWPDFEFPVKPGRKMIGFTGDKFLLRFVEHPGVAPRPFLRPAIESEITSIRSQFAGLLSKAYRETVISIEVIK